jgi:hypothetical protein
MLRDSLVVRGFRHQGDFTLDFFIGNLRGLEWFNRLRLCQQTKQHSNQASYWIPINTKNESVGVHDLNDPLARAYAKQEKLKAMADLHCRIAIASSRRDNWKLGRQPNPGLAMCRVRVPKHNPSCRREERGVHAASARANRHAQKISNAPVNPSVEAT